VFRTWYGPTSRGSAALDAAGQERLAEDILARLGRRSRGGEALVVPGEYLRAVVRRG
jgi:hypothetical protein